jgi:hypothetical protein
MGENMHFTTPLMRLQDPQETKVILVTLAETTPSWRPQSCTPISSAPKSTDRTSSEGSAPSYLNRVTPMCRSGRMQLSRTSKPRDRSRILDEVSRSKAPNAVPLGGL